MPEKKPFSQIVTEWATQIKFWAGAVIAVATIVTGTAYVGGTPNGATAAISDSLKQYVSPMLKEIEENVRERRLNTLRINQIERNAKNYATKGQVDSAVFAIHQTLTLGLRNLDDQNSALRRRLDSLLVKQDSARRLGN